MRRLLLILGSMFTVCLCADNHFTDDIYYYPTLTPADSLSNTIKPYYNSKTIKELVFIDTLSVGRTDTVQEPIANLPSVAR